MSKLNILWVNDNHEVADKMVFMYSVNAKMKDWWTEVDVIIWGPTAKLVAENKHIQERIYLAQQAGVNVIACRSCAEQYGLVDKLEELEIEVKYMGGPLTDMLKSDEKLLTI